MAPYFLFYMFASVLLLSACGVVFNRNPLYSVLCLIVAFFNAAGLFLLTGAEWVTVLACSQNPSREEEGLWFDFW